MTRFYSAFLRASGRSVGCSSSNQLMRFPSAIPSSFFDRVRLLLLLLAWCLAGGGEILAQSQSANQCAGVPTGAATFGDLLQGKLPGVNIVQIGGASGGAGRIRLRGVNSVRAKNPIIVIDNIRVTPLNYQGERGLHSIALLEVVNPTDITRVEVLRGPAATIQYGDAADGVIRIFTRRGSEQPMASQVARPECRTQIRKP